MINICSGKSNYSDNFDLKSELGWADRRVYISPGGDWSWLWKCVIKELFDGLQKYCRVMIAMEFQFLIILTVIIIHNKFSKIDSSRSRLMV